MDKTLGTVKFFNSEKGFGFIKHDDSNKETFVHVSGLINDIKYQNLPAGDVNDGRVISQSREAQTAVAPGTKVTLVIGKSTTP